MERRKKEQVVEELNAKFQKSKAVFVTDFKGLHMSSLNTLRQKVRQAGGEFQVAKNTLVKLAAKDNPVHNLTSFLEGNNALGLTDNDPAALAKALFDFAKEQEKFTVKGGVLGDRPITVSQIKALANLPSREALLSSLLGTMQAVPTSFVRVLAAVPQKFVYALAAIRDQKTEA